MKSNKDKSVKMVQKAAPPEYQAKPFQEGRGSQSPNVFESKFSRIRTVSEKELCDSCV